MTSRIWLPIAAVAAALVATLSALADLGRLTFVQGVIDGVPCLDKLCHFLAMAGASYPLCRALPRRRLGGLPIAAVLLSVATTAEEASQLAFASRTFDLGDLGANLAGIWGAAYLASGVASAGTGRPAPASTP